MTRTIEPTKGRVLVKLKASNYGDIPVPPKDYESVMEGIILKVHPLDEKEFGYLIGRKGYWKQFKDDLRFTENSETLALIPINDIDGTAFEE